MTNSAIKKQIIKTVEFSIERLDGIDLFILFHEELFGNIERFYEILGELIKEGSLKREYVGAYTYYIMVD